MLIYPSSMSATTLTDIIFDKVVMLKIEELRVMVFEQYQKDYEMDLIKSQSTGHSQSVSASQTEAIVDSAALPSRLYNTLDDVRAVLTLDGEIEQIEYILQKIASKHKGIEFFKFSGGCSPHQQPNDVMKSFSIVKILEKSRRYDDTIIKPNWYDRYEGIFNKKKIFSPASRHSILRFLRNLPTILDEAYSIHNIQDGWRKTGLLPYNPEVILGHWPFHQYLTHQERKKLCKAVIALAVIAKRDGHIGEADLESHLADAIGDGSRIKYRAFDSSDDESNSDSTGDIEDDSNDDDEEVEPKKKRARKPLEQRPLNHGRCMWLNHVAFIAKYLAIKLAKEMAAAEAAEKKAQKEAAKQLKAAAASAKKAKATASAKKKEATASTATTEEATASTATTADKVTASANTGNVTGKKRKVGHK